MKEVRMPNFSLPDSVFESAAQAFPTPFYLYDEKGIRKRAKDVQKAFAWNEGFKEYFAVKALPNPAILKILMEEGCGLDCSSKTELLMAQKIGCQGDDIMFSANAMPPEEFTLARQMGAIINLDDISDIDTLKENGGIPELISMRLNPGGSIDENAAIMGEPKEAKFGWMPSQLNEGLSRLKALGVKRFGLHAMLASSTRQNDYYPKLCRFLLKEGLKLEKETGLTFEFINLSGGIGIPYRPEEKGLDILEVGAMVQNEYKKMLGKRDDIRIYTEMGRYMTGPFGFLVTRAMHLKQTHKNFLGVDACAANLMRPAMYGAYHHITVCGKRSAPEDTLYDVTGALCENNDKFAINRMLPKVEMGDLLFIHDAGAHGFAMGYQYNGRLRSAEVLYTKEGDYQLIRRAETPEDYFATMVF
jgi:diaminopimelate decarboxylase